MSHLILVKLNPVMCNSDFLYHMDYPRSMRILQICMLLLEDSTKILEMEQQWVKCNVSRKMEQDGAVTCFS